MRAMDVVYALKSMGKSIYGVPIPNRFPSIGI